MSDPTWPPLGLELNDLGGDWTAFCEHCYAEYYRDFHQTKPIWPIDGFRFAIKRQPEFDGKCNTFWHIISEGSDERSRTPALERCARICWPRLLLDEFATLFPLAQSDRIAWWKTKRGSEHRYVIALADFTYVVVIAERQDYVLLWTAYPVEHPSQRKKLKRGFEEYWR